MQRGMRWRWLPVLALTLGTLVTGCGNTAPSPPTFAAQVTYPVGLTPDWIDTADVNGDGKPDLLVANYGDDTVSVLLNTAATGATTPSFTMQATLAVGSGPNGLAVADVNGDGKPDILVTYQNGNTVGVLLNTTATGATTPSFTDKTTFDAGFLPSSVVAVDVNGDGKPDIVASHGNTVGVLLNTAATGATTPSFAMQATFATSSATFTSTGNYFGVAVADVNGDGKPDIVVTNQGSNTAGVLLNTAPHR